MTKTFPTRRNDLDRYESISIRWYNTHGQKAFTEYHNMFPAKAAAYIENEKYKVSWTIRDIDVYASVIDGRRPNVCAICYSIEHTTNR